MTNKQAFRLQFSRLLNSEHGSPDECLKLTEAFIKHNTANNIKEKVRKTIMPKGVGVEAASSLKNKLDTKYPTLEVIMKVYFETFVCTNCCQMVCSEREDEEIPTYCENCNIFMQEIGPIVLTTSNTQLMTAL